MIRVTFGGPGLSGFASTGVGDEYVRLFFPDPETGEVVLPIVDGRGFWSWPEGRKPAHTEPYTVRRFDGERGEIDIDFVVHEGGRASEWAQRARPGDGLVINQPHGLYEAPDDIEWVLFACDATGIPALGRLLEDLPASVEARAIVEIADPAHELTLMSPARLDVTWLHGSGNGIAPSRLPEAVGAMKLPARPGYVWIAAEQKAARPLRRRMRHELKLPGDRYSVTAYWTDHLAEWQAGWSALDPAIKARIEAAWASDRDRDDVADEVDAILDTAGL
ncbi:MAG: siderophore-interacting protein [Bauldia sp.]|nr:siderophore-interacting protein [Bauldia sp.]MCW5716349.1 siderophore-interacting protein [Bauldia sp.]